MSRIFLDSAHPQEVQEGMATGLVEGITTNPSLLAKTVLSLPPTWYVRNDEQHHDTPQDSQWWGALGPQKQEKWAHFWREWRVPLCAWGFNESVCRLLLLLCHVCPGPVSIEVVAKDAATMEAQGRILWDLSPNVVIKVPLTPEGLKACNALTQQGIPVNVTLCFSPMQGILAAKAGATYVSPFMGRLNDMATGEAQDLGGLLITEMAEIFQRHQLSCCILAASLRHPKAVFQAIYGGAKAITVPHDVFFQLYQHPLTSQGLLRFDHDWQRLQGVTSTIGPEDGAAPIA